MSSPELSIIIPTLNRASLLKRSLDSIFSCVDAELPNTEVIVIDGGSKDGTCDLLASYGKRIAHWKSETNKNLTDGFNRGLAAATAPVIRFFGDDDEVLPNGLAPIMKLLADKPEFEIIGGHNAPFYEEEDGSKTPIQQKRYCGEVRWPDLMEYAHPRFVIPEVCFIRKSLFDRIGNWDVSITWMSFLDWFFRALAAGSRIFIKPIVIQNTYQDRKRGAWRYPQYGREVYEILQKWKR